MARPLRWPLASRLSLALFFLGSTCLLSTLIFDLLSADRSQGVYVSLPDDVKIDDVISGSWQHDSPGPLLYLPRSCRPRGDLVFLKSTASAGEVVGALLRGYAYRHNLSTALPVGGRSYLGWPYPLTAADVRPSSRGYNLLVERAVHNASFVRELMNPGTPLVALIRQPLDLFLDTLRRFNVLQLANVSGSGSVHGGMGPGPGPGPVQAYLRDIHRYEEAYKSRQAAPRRDCVPDGFSVTRNPLSHGLGMPLGFPPGRDNFTDDPGAVEGYLAGLDSQFVLVMIAEYLDESLVLLRRLMCWDTKDVLYRVESGGDHDDHRRQDEVWRQGLTLSDRHRHRQWSGVDYLLYDLFNRTFWDKVRRQGEDFLQEVTYFRRVQSQLGWFCRSVTPYGESYIRFPESVWSPAFTFSSEECRLMAAPLLDKLKERYQKEEPNHTNSPTVTTAPRKFTPLC